MTDDREGKMSDIVERLRREAFRDDDVLIDTMSVICEAADEIERLRTERLKLDKRIHNQRMALRQNWEIVEMRRNYMGSPASRAAYARLLKRHQALLAVSRS